VHQHPFVIECVSEVLANAVPPRRPRHNPRAVKRKMSNWPLKPLRPTLTHPAPSDASSSIRVLWR
jgi:hypothetical protein